jgi:hypothetical protein
MRARPLALVLLAGTACRGGALQPDAGGGPGMLSVDATGGDGAGTSDRGPGTTDVAPPTPDHNCGVTSIGGGFVPAQILLLVDRSVANPSQWANVITALSNAVVQHDARVDWGLYTFPGAGPTCWAGPVSSAVDIPILPMNGATVAADIRATLADGNGSPIAAAIALGANYLGTLGADQPKFMLLATDHAPTCAGATFETLSADANQAQNDAVAALRAAAAAGFKTMVLAPSTTADVGSLDQLAEAGGLPRSTGLIEFNTETTLADQFATTTAANCIFGLSSAPPVPANITVAFNGMPVPRDTQHMDGWDYSAPASNIIQFFGDWCVQALDSRSFQVTVLYGCPVPVPLP